MPYVLLPGTSAALHRYGTVTLAMLARIIKRVLSTDASLVADIAKFGAAAMAARVHGRPPGYLSSTVGSDLRTNNARGALNVNGQRTAAEAEASEAAAVSWRASCYRVRPRVAGSPATQLEKQGFPMQSVSALCPVPVDPSV